MKEMMTNSKPIRVTLEDWKARNVCEKPLVVAISAPEKNCTTPTSP